MATFSCPQCGEPWTEFALGDHRCRACGATLPHEAGAQPASAGDAPQGHENFTEFDLAPSHQEAREPLEFTLPEVRIRRSGSGETLAVLALLLPLLAQGLILACRFDSLAIGVVLGWGTVIVTAVLLAIDAALLGTIDLQGTRRASPGALFAGIFLLWIVCYPVAFFRRRHFGRPNLGVFAIVVAVFFVAVPFVQEFMSFGTIGGGPPSCTSREVIIMVDNMIRQGNNGAAVLSISGHREIRYDPAGEIRTGQCTIKTLTETIAVTFTVKLLNRNTGVFEVNVQPIISEDPPSCTSPEVMDLLEDIVRRGPNGHLLKHLAGHMEIRYDRENKIRHGRCQAIMQDWTGNLSYKVYWQDQKAGLFQAQIEP